MTGGPGIRYETVLYLASLSRDGWGVVDSFQSYLLDPEDTAWVAGDDDEDHRPRCFLRLTRRIGPGNGQRRRRQRGRGDGVTDG